jgi:hypothetical protein
MGEASNQCAKNWLEVDCRIGFSMDVKNYMLRRK